jgi:hypothetical protein
MLSSICETIVYKNIAEGEIAQIEHNFPFSARTPQPNHQTIYSSCPTLSRLVCKQFTLQRALLIEIGLY